jgi:hypothetical protein
MNLTYSPANGSLKPWRRKPTTSWTAVRSPCSPVLHSGLTKNGSARVQPTKTSDRETREGIDGGGTDGRGLRTATATREGRRRRTGGGLSDTSCDGADRARRCRFQVCSLASTVSASPNRSILSDPNCLLNSFRIPEFQPSSVSYILAEWTSGDWWVRLHDESWMPHLLVLGPIPQAKIRVIEQSVFKELGWSRTRDLKPT